MGLRSVVRYIGLMMILALYIDAGVEQLLHPDVGASRLVNSYFPYYLEVAGVHLPFSHYRQLIQATGAAFLSLSIFVLLGVGRGFFAFLLAMGTLCATLVFFVDPRNPQAVRPEQQAMILVNTAIAGGLLCVTGSVHRLRKRREPVERDEGGWKRRKHQ